MDQYPIKLKPLFLPQLGNSTNGQESVQPQHLPDFFGTPQGGSLFGSPPPDKYAGPITDEKQEMTETRRPDGTIERKVTVYRWHGGPQWHRKTKDEQ
ncbi:MAG: hypothetical protein QM775_25710 [Pirellulales bacterium]